MISLTLTSLSVSASWGRTVPPSARAKTQPRRKYSPATQGQRGTRSTVGVTQTGNEICAFYFAHIAVNDFISNWSALKFAINRTRSDEKCLKPCYWPPLSPWTNESDVCRTSQDNFASYKLVRTEVISAFNSSRCSLFSCLQRKHEYNSRTVKRISRGEVKERKHTSLILSWSGSILRVDKTW